MNARLQRKLRLLTVVVVTSVIAGIAFSLALGFTSSSGIEVGILYGLLLSVTIGGISQFVLEGPMRGWLGSFSFTASLMVRSAIYAAIIVPIFFSSWVTSSPGLSGCGTFRTWLAQLMRSAHGVEADLAVGIPSVPMMCISAVVFIECSSGRLAGNGSWMADDDRRHEGYLLRIALCGTNDGTASSVDDVVVCTRRVINGVTATPHGTTFQCTELRSQARVVQQFDAPAVEQGQQIQIKI